MIGAINASFENFHDTKRNYNDQPVHIFKQTFTTIVLYGNQIYKSNIFN